MQEKPRVSYADFVEKQKRERIYKEGTVAWLIERYIKEMSTSAEMKPLGESHVYGLRALARSPIGTAVAAKLTKQDIIGYCRWRKQQKVKNSDRIVCAATVGQDISFLTVVLKYAGAAWADCDEVSAASITAARKFLVKHGLIGKSAPRDRRPTDEEIHLLLDYFAKQKQHPRTKIDMAQVVAFALVSTRRLGEICRITHGDVDWEKKTYWVRDLKHPTKKKGNDKEFPLFPELADIIKRQPRLTDSPAERIFPYNSKCCSQSYAQAKQKLGIVGLRFHDNRREAITRWLAHLPPHEVRQISGHETTVILERVYARPKATDLGEKVARMRAASPVQ
jgi:integrase